MIIALQKLYIDYNISSISLVHLLYIYVKCGLDDNLDYTPGKCDLASSYSSPVSGFDYHTEFEAGHIHKINMNYECASMDNTSAHTD